MAMSKQRLITVSVFSTLSFAILVAYVVLRTTSNQCSTDADYLSSFDATQYMGRWYEVARNQGLPFQSGDCTTADYTLRSDGLVEVLNTQYFISDAQLDDITGKAWVNQWYPGLLNVSFFADFGGPYQILDTDFDIFIFSFSF